MAAPMPDVRYWPLDEESGETASDLISGVDARVIGDPQGDTHSPNGKFGYCRDFQAADGGVSHLILWSGDEVEGGALSTWTLTCWVRKDGGSASTGGPTLWMFGGFITGKETLWSRVWNSGDGAHLEIYDASGSPLGEADYFDGQMFDDQWHLIAIRCDGETTELHVDGQLRDTAFAAISINPMSQSCWFGGEGYSLGAEGDSYADYMADDIQIHGRSLTDEELGEIWNEGEGQEPSIGGTSAIAHISDPLGEISALAFVDWTNLIDPITTRTYYACDIQAPGMDAIRVPISSWQGTQQTGRASYLQAVIPAATEWLDAITARSEGEFIIRRGALRSDGSTSEAEMARAPIQESTYNEGPQNATLTLSGYLRLPDEPGGSGVRQLTGIRQRSISGGALRVRCDIDWFLRPGGQCSALGTQFQADWINYYVGRNQEYMDVGQRNG